MEDQSANSPRHDGVRPGPEPAGVIASDLRDPSGLARIPVTYQELNNYFAQFGQANPYPLRRETYLRIERITRRPLICYVAKTRNLVAGAPASIDDSDLTGFGDLVRSVPRKSVDVFLVSNGGSAEAAERIVRLLREHFTSVRFIIPANAYSAATLICFSGDQILMDAVATLGPIDPQIGGIPARAILRGFQAVTEVLKKEGPEALPAYMPLLSKYDLHTFEICRSAEELSKELAQNWLSTYMLKCPASDPRVVGAVEFFSNYDIHKSHGRPIDRGKARELNLRVENVERIKGLGDLVRSLYNQYELLFDKTAFVKMFEDARGINWGRQAPAVTLQLPLMMPPVAPQPTPQPGPPQPTA